MGIWIALFFVLAIALINAWRLGKITKLNADLYNGIHEWMKMQDRLNKEVAELIREFEATQRYGGKP